MQNIKQHAIISSEGGKKALVDERKEQDHDQRTNY
nr:MAG TPA: hypothetical protein [Caudoviricetes sp.]